MKWLGWCAVIAFAALFAAGVVGIAMGDMALREEARRQAGRPYAEAAYLACVEAYSAQGWFAVDSVSAHCKRMARDVYNARGQQRQKEAEL